MVGVISLKGGYQGDSIPPFRAIYFYLMILDYSTFRNKVKKKFSPRAQMQLL
jgi:hypothetical protein